MKSDIELSEQIWQVQQGIAKHFSQTRPQPRIALWACVATIADILGKLESPQVAQQFLDSTLALLGKLTGTEQAGVLMPTNIPFPDATKPN